MYRIRWLFVSSNPIHPLSPLITALNTYRKLLDAGMASTYTGFTHAVKGMGGGCVGLMMIESSGSVLVISPVPLRASRRPYIPEQPVRLPPRWQPPG